MAFSLVLGVMTSNAQVKDIKGASSGNASRGGDVRTGSGGGGGFFGNGYFFVRGIQGMVLWQQDRMQKRDHVPSVLSLEIFAQAAIQPSTYYVMTPRVRGNWGIFFTDFRENYMLEQAIDGYNDLRTDDWQILGLNLFSNRIATGRISSGIMHEAFGGGKTFSESAVSLSLTNDSQKFGGNAEFRWARDYVTGATPRIEASLFVQKKLFDAGAIHMFATGGAVFQRYYSQYNVWGIQGGLIFKLYRANL